MLRGWRVQAAHLPLRLPGPRATRRCGCSSSAKKALTGLPIVTEIMSTRRTSRSSRTWTSCRSAPATCRTLICSRKLGKLNKPILLKRGLANTIEEWLMSAEYIMAGGNENVILCERGIRTFETYTRNTLDISARARR